MHSSPATTWVIEAIPAQRRMPASHGEQTSMWAITVNGEEAEASISKSDSNVLSRRFREAFEKGNNQLFKLYRRL